MRDVCVSVCECESPACSVRNPPPPPPPLKWPSFHAKRQRSQSARRCKSSIDWQLSQSAGITHTLTPSTPTFTSLSLLNCLDYYHEPISGHRTTSAYLTAFPLLLQSLFLSLSPVSGKESVGHSPEILLYAAAHCTL